ncbi:MAG: tetratricopeptide repeat protein, partial [Sphingopyxis sp.]|nr:tetratricopeptide repeat protein [Sphingopyxis sp.]
MNEAPPPAQERVAMAEGARTAEEQAMAAGNHIGAGWIALASATITSDETLRSAHYRRAHSHAVSGGDANGSHATVARMLIDIHCAELIEAGRYADAAGLVDALISDLDSAGPRAASGIDRGSRIGLIRRRAEAYAMLGRIEDANADWDVALAAATAAEGSTGDSVGHVHNQRSYYLNLQGRFAEAEAPGLAAARIWERTRGRSSLATQKARYNYATAQLGQGNATAALPYFVEALPIQRSTRGARVSDTSILQTTIARTLEQIGGREAEALAAAREAMDIVRSIRSSTLAGAGDNIVDHGLVALSRAIAAGQRRHPLSSAFDVGMLAAWDARGGDANALDTAFRAAQDLTLSDSGDAINQATARRIAGPGPLGELIRDRQDAAQAALAADAALRESATGADRAASDRAAATRAMAAQRLAALDARLATEFPAYRALVEPGSVAVADVQAALRPDQAMLLLMSSEGHHYAFAIGHDRVAWHRIDGGGDRIGALVTRLRCRIDEATCSVADFEAAIAAEQTGPASPIDQFYPRFDRGAAHHLYRELIAPVESALPQGGRVYVVASGPMAALPMATLVTEDPGREAVSGDASVLAATSWLGDRYAFVTLGSVSALSAMQRAAQRGDGAGRRSAGMRGERHEARAERLETRAGRSRAD